MVLLLISGFNTCANLNPAAVLVLLDEFTNFILTHKSKYVQYLFQQFKIKFPEKYETITMHCDNIERLHELLSDEFINTLLHQNQ